VLTTRSSGVTSASRLALDDVRLMTPRNLDGVLVRLLRHIADVRIPEADRDAWVAERAQRVRSITGAHKDMGSVPLLAVLGSWRNARPLLTKRPVAAADSGGHRPSLCPRCAHTGVVLTARCMLWGLLVSPGPSATPESAQEATVRDRCRSARVLRGFRASVTAAANDTPARSLSGERHCLPMNDTPAPGAVGNAGSDHHAACLQR